MCETELALAVIGWAALLVSMLVIIRVKHMVMIDLGLDLGKYQLFGGCVMSRKTWPKEVKEAPGIKIGPQIYYNAMIYNLCKQMTLHCIQQQHS